MNRRRVHCALSSLSASRPPPDDGDAAFDSTDEIVFSAMSSVKIGIDFPTESSSFNKGIDIVAVIGVVDSSVDTNVISVLGDVKSVVP